MIENPKMQVTEIVRQSYLRGIQDFVEGVNEVLASPDLAGATMTPPQVAMILNEAKRKCIESALAPDRN